MDLVIATSNVHKLAEIRQMLPDGFNVTGLKENGFKGEIPETGTTFEENALIKARFVYQLYERNCLSDDSGLMVEALDNRPGIFSARFAGPNATDEENVRLLLSELKFMSNRKACFRAVIVLIVNKKEWFFDGQVKGVIAHEQSGEGGFGYDPVFIPEGYNLPFSALPGDVKSTISHRAIAMKKVREFLEGREWE